MRQRVLVVDGDPGTRRAIELMLAERDIEVFGSSTDDEAYKRVLELGPDLLLVEVLVPRHGGLELLRRIRGVIGGQEIPAIVMSALCRDADVRKEAVGDLGALEFMKKPLSAELLRERLDSLLGNQETGGTLPGTVPFQRAEMYDKGSLSDVESPILLQSLAHHKTTGCLYLRHGAGKKVIYFQDGTITFALSNQLRETLGHYLVGTGKISKEVTEAALEAMRSEGKKLGEYLVGAGLLDMNEMLQAVRHNVLEKVLDVFSWQSGDFSLSAYKNPPAPLPGQAFPVSHVLWEGVKKPFPEGRLRATLTPHDRLPLFLRRDLFDLATEVSLGSEELRLLRTVRRLQGQPLGQVLGEMGGELGVRFLYFLLLQGYLSLGSGRSEDPSDRRLTPDTATRIRDARKRLESDRRRNHFQVLGVSLDGDDDTVHQAYLRKAKELHPDTLGPGEPDELRQIYNDTFQLVRASYEVLKTECGRREHLRSVEGGAVEEPVTGAADVLEAEVHFRKGQMLLKQRGWDAAAEAFEEALRLNPEEAEYTFHLGTARLQQFAAGRRELFSEAEALLTEARRLLPNSPEPCYQLGRLASLRGEAQKAAGCFEKALERDPNHWSSSRELRLMQMRARKSGKRSAVLN